MVTVPPAHRQQVESIILFTWGFAFQHASPVTWGEGLPPGGLGSTPPRSADIGGSLGTPPQVCLHGGGTDSPPRDTWDTTGYGQQADGTHPTGMHSCFM